MARRWTVLLIPVLLGGLLAACGDDDEGVETRSTAPDTETTTTTTDDPDPDPPAEGELPGERIEIFPNEGDELAVVAVATDDTLNMRRGPGVDFEVVHELEPLATGVVASGHNRSLDDGAIWAEVTAAGATGWVSSAFLAHLGDTRDITADLYPATADRPTAETMVDLGRAVADDAAPAVEGEPELTVTVVDGPEVGDVGEITLDVTGYADDSVLGARLTVFAEPDPGGESFTVRSVESTPLCRRGVSDGLCL